MPLKLARERRDAARALVDAGVDPSNERKAKRAAREDTFEVIAARMAAGTGKVSCAKNLQEEEGSVQYFRLSSSGQDTDCANRAPEVLSVLKRMEARGKMETSRRVRADCGRVFRYAVVTARAERDPTVKERNELREEPERREDAIRKVEGHITTNPRPPTGVSNDSVGSLTPRAESTCLNIIGVMLDGLFQPRDGRPKLALPLSIHREIERGGPVDHWTYRRETPLPATTLWTLTKIP